MQSAIPTERSRGLFCVKANVTTDCMRRGVAMPAGQWAFTTNSRAMFQSSAGDEDRAIWKLKVTAGIGFRRGSWDPGQDGQGRGLLKVQHISFAEGGSAVSSSRLLQLQQG